MIQAEDEKSDAYYLAMRGGKLCERHKSYFSNTSFNTGEALATQPFNGSEKWHFTKLVTQVLTTAMVDSQTSLSKGCKNTNRLTSSFFGFCINKLTLKSMKGLLKSTSSSLAAEIVMAPMAT